MPEEEKLDLKDKRAVILRPSLKEIFNGLALLKKSFDGKWNLADFNN